MKSLWVDNSTDIHYINVNDRLLKYYDEATLC